MEIAEYKNIFENEKTHFYYVGTHNAVIKLLNAYLPKKKNNEVLDAGCGTGALIKKLQRFGNVWGIDLSSEALKFARKNKLRRIKRGSVENIPFKDSQFDAVVSVDVLYHRQVKDDKRALREFKRVLKPGGILIIKNPAHDWLRGGHDKIIHTKRRYSKSDLEIKLKESGFSIIKLSYVNMFFFPFAVTKRVFESLSYQKPHSDVAPLHPLLNNFLKSVYNLEMEIWTRATLPFGLSLFAIAKKPKPPWKN